MSLAQESSSPIRVLVADDSAVMRVALSRMLESNPQVRVCGTARDGLETVEKTKLLHPDVVTLDVEMPGLDGIQALKRIMSECPCPVIMVSCMTGEGAETTVEALSSGAFDCLPKDDVHNDMDLLRLQHDLLEKVEEAAHSPLGAHKQFSPDISLELPDKFLVVPQIAVVGTSTGGPRALQEIIPALPAELPIPILIVQHMPAGFTGPLASRLNAMSKIKVCEAEDGDRVEPGTVYIAPAGWHTTIFSSGPHTWIFLASTPAETMHKPSVDVTMNSAASIFGANVMGIILTGMGSDGLDGMKAIRRAGGITIGQDEATSAVYGMPRSCAESGVLQRVVPLGEVSNVILEAVRYKPQP